MQTRVGFWLQGVKADHDAPDLWGEIAKGRTIAEAATDKQDATPFAPAEIKQLDAGLDEIERYVGNQQPLSPEGSATVKRRFEYLRGAARRGVSKIDWLNIFMGQMVSLVMEGVMSPAVYGR